jgi:glycosyltransferase involved in cell wall biosynthesis
MRVLHLLTNIEEVGAGITNVAMDLACLQAAAGHEVSVASAGGEYEDLLRHHGIRHFTLNQRRTPLNLFRAAKRFHEIIRTAQPDIVHAHMMTCIMLASALRARTKYQLVATVHNEFQRSAVLMGLADRVIAVSDAVADSMERRGIPRRKISTVKNGTLGSPRSRFSRTVHGSVRPELHRPAITTVAGMFRRKGIAELIAAFEKIAREFPEAHLYIVGDGLERAEFEAQARRTAFAARIHFEGFQPQPRDYLESSDVFVLASHVEAWGLVLSEAREAGCAIVATEVGGIPEALDGGKAGVLVPPRDVDALAAAIARLLRDDDERHGLQARARENLSSAQVSRMHDETIAVYGELYRPAAHAVRFESA